MYVVKRRFFYNFFHALYSLYSFGYGLQGLLDYVGCAAVEPITEIWCQSIGLGFNFMHIEDIPVWILRV